MIIRATVKDNDFEGVMSTYFFRFIQRMLDFEDELQESNEVGVLLKSEQLSQLLNPNSAIDYTEEQKQILIDRVKETFNAYVDRADRLNAEYLKENFEVTIIDSMTDKWENGEVWYWFQQSNACLHQ